MKGAQWPAPWRAEGSWPTPSEVDLRWSDRAACRGVDDATSDRLVCATRADDVTDLAARLCRTCPVRRACYDAGVAMRATGTWGGVVLSDGRPEQRRRKVAS